MIRLLLFLFPILLIAQVGVNTTNPHPESDMHLASKNKSLILNHVDDLSKITNPYEGMIVYDYTVHCFKGYQRDGWSECFAGLKPDPVVVVEGPGFKGDFVRGKALNNATFEITITNNTFQPVVIGLNVNDLKIDNSDITATAVYLADNTPSGTQFDLNLVSGASKTIVFKLEGSPLAPYTQIKGTWTKLNMEFENSINVKYEFDCSLGEWSEAINPEVLGNLDYGETYKGVYKIPYSIDATGFDFDYFNQTSNGLTMISDYHKGSTSGEILINLSGTYNSKTENNFLFLPPYGCQIQFKIPKSCKEIKEMIPNSQSNIYEIDIDGDASTYSKINAYCDMETDGGGWTLVLNYNHKGGKNSSTKQLTDRLPLIGSTKLGVDESTIENNKYWGHMNLDIAKAITFKELRFYGISNSIQSKIVNSNVNAKGNNGRVIHFKTSLSNAIDYVKTGKGNMKGIEKSFTPLSGHTSFLPASTDNFYSDYGGDALLQFPFYRAGTSHWGIRGASSRWEVDDYPNNYNFDTYHQVWIR